MAGKIASVDEVREWWSCVMWSDDESMIQRLKASELLAKSYGLFQYPERPETFQSTADVHVKDFFSRFTTEEIQGLLDIWACWPVGKEDIEYKKLCDLLREHGESMKMEV